MPQLSSLRSSGAADQLSNSSQTHFDMVQLLRQCQGDLCCTRGLIFNSHWNAGTIGNMTTGVSETRPLLLVTVVELKGDKKRLEVRQGEDPAVSYTDFDEYGLRVDLN